MGSVPNRDDFFGVFTGCLRKGSKSECFMLKVGIKFKYVLELFETSFPPELEQLKICFSFHLIALSIFLEINVPATFGLC